MKKGVTLLIVLLVGWIALSTWWYVCKVKGIGNRSNQVAQQNNLHINLDGENEMVFAVTTTKDGAISFQNQTAGQSIGIVKAYLDEHPEMNISISGNNENIIEAILATYKIIGIDDNRINYAITGNKKAPTSIINIQNPNYNQFEDTLSIDSLEITAEVTETTEENTSQTASPPIDVETAPKLKAQNWIPCPDVNTRGSYPKIEYILFGSASYKVTCPEALKTYAKAAKDYITQSGGTIVVTGHTDYDKKQINNLSLGLKRASEVKKYLMRYGIPSENIETYSKGDSEPIGDNETEAGKQLNRRVTIELY